MHLAELDQHRACFLALGRLERKVAGGDDGDEPGGQLRVVRLPVPVRPGTRTRTWLLDCPCLCQRPAGNTHGCCGEWKGLCGRACAFLFWGDNTTTPPPTRVTHATFGQDSLISMKSATGTALRTHLKR